MSVAASVIRSSSRGPASPGGWIIPTALTRGLQEGFRLGDLRVVNQRGTERYSEVYTVTRAIDGSSHTARVVRRTALTACPDIAASLLLTARLLGGVRHANLPAVLGAGWTDEPTRRPFLVHERIAGRDLAAYQSRHGSVEPALLLAVASQCAAALEVCHRLGMAHADLRSSNVLLGSVGDGFQVKLCGFERARSIEPGATAQDEPLVASDLAGLGELLRGLAAGVDVEAAAPGFTRVLQRLALAEGLGSATELRAALASIESDPANSASAIPAVDPQLRESPPSAATASSSGRWGARPEGRSFGQVSLRMTRERPPQTHSAARWAIAVFVLGAVLTSFAARALAPEIAVREPVPVAASEPAPAPMLARALPAPAPEQAASVLASGMGQASGAVVTASTPGAAPEAEPAPVRTPVAAPSPCPERRPEARRPSTRRPRPESPAREPGELRAIELPGVREPEDAAAAAPVAPAAEVETAAPPALLPSPETAADELMLLPVLGSRDAAPAGAPGAAGKDLFLDTNH